MPQCMSPLVLKRDEPNKYGYYSEKVPCSKCYNCKKNRTAQWVFRLKQEYKRADSAIFLTCTYEDEHLSWVRQPTGELQKNLNYRDHQLFIKRLRKAATKSEKPLKYYGVGEYGEKFERPHFHYILFNLLDYQREEWFIKECWQNGDVRVDPCTSRSMAYVTGYVDKKIVKPEMAEKDARRREKSFMSKGLGETFITTPTLEYYKRKKRGYIDLGNNKVSMPRYYKNKLYDSLEQVQVNSNVALYLIDNELPQWKQFEINKRAWQKGEMNKIWREHKLIF